MQDESEQLAVADSNYFEPGVPYIGSGELARHLSVSRQTVCRWRMCGYLPKPIRTQAGVCFWPKSAIEAWQAAGCPWADKRHAKLALRRFKNCSEFNEHIRPQFDEPISEAGRQKLDELEKMIDECDLFISNTMKDEIWSVENDSRFRMLMAELRSVRSALQVFF